MFSTADEFPGKLIPFSQVPSLDWIPARRNGTRLSIQTVYRWHFTGLKGADSSNHKLQAVKAGGTLATTESWLRAFFVVLSRTPDQQITTSDQHERAEARLEAVGL